MNVFRRFLKGIVLRGETSDPSDNIEGSLFHNSTSNRLKTYIQAAVRTLVTEDQTQTLSNKSIDADNNPISNLEVDNLKAGVLDTDLNAVSALDDTLPSAKATKSYVDQEVGVVQTNLNNHINDTTDAHDASAISVVPTGNLAADDVQEALEELQGDINTNATNIGTVSTDLSNHINDTTDAHDASAISVVPTGNLAADDVQEGLVELQGDIDTINTTLTNKVTGPASATDNAVTRYDGTTGKLVQDSVVTIDDVGVTSGITQLNVDNIRVDGNTISSTDTNGNLTLDPNGTGDVVANKTLRTVTTEEKSSANDTATGSNATLTFPATGIVRLTGALTSIDMIPAGQPGQVLILENHTGSNVIVNNDTGATAANRILTGTKANITVSDEASLSLVYDGTEQRWMVIGGTGSSSLNNPYNYLTGDNFRFENSVGNYGTYADAAGTSPVDGTGGTPNVTIARTTTLGEVLEGVASLEFTKDAVNRQGQGFSVDIDGIGEADINKPGRISFDYKVTSGTFASGSSSSNSDIMVFIYDKDNLQMISPFPNYLDGSGRFVGFFNFTSSKNYRLIFHVATTSASAYSLSFDNVSFARNEQMTLSADSDWQSYTPTFTGLGTVTNISFEYRKDGSDILIRGKATVGTPTATEMRISLPTGLLSKSTIATIEVAGILGRGGATANFYGYYVTREPNVNYMTFSTQTSAQNIFSKQNGNGIFSAGEVLGVEARIPIQGWSTGFTTAETILQNVPVTFRAYRNGGSITANTTIASWTAVEKDSVGAFNSTTGEYTVKVPGDYYFAATIGTTANISGTAYISVNGTIKILGSNESSDNRDAISGILPNLVVGDIITLKHGTSATGEANNYATTFMCAKIESPNASLNIPKVAYLKDVKASGTAGGTFTSGAYQTRTLNDEVDPFGIVTLSANQFTLQAGTYEIEASALVGLVNGHKLKIRNITDSSDTIIGLSNITSSTDGSSDVAELSGTFSISSTKTFELQHRCQTTKATDGFGAAVTFGDSEVFAQVKITRLF